MNLKLAVLILLILQLFHVSCILKDKSRKEIQIDSILSKSKIYSNREFDFKDYTTQNVWDWPYSNDIMKLDSNFYDTFLKSEKIFNQWGEYQDLYLVGVSKFGDERYLIIGQRIHNGDELNMYLLDFESNGSIKQLVKVASQYKAPDDYNYCKSKYFESTLIRTTIKLISDIDNSDIESKDSIIETIDLNNFSVMKYDSVRVK
jgi:hypothetical protein